LTYCEDSKEIPYAKSDLSIELKNKLNSLQKIADISIKEVAVVCSAAISFTLLKNFSALCL